MVVVIVAVGVLLMMLVFENDLRWTEVVMVDERAGVKEVVDMKRNGVSSSWEWKVERQKSLVVDEEMSLYQQRD